MRNLATDTAVACAVCVQLSRQLLNGLLIRQKGGVCGRHWGRYTMRGTGTKAHRGRTCSGGSWDGNGCRRVAVDVNRTTVASRRRSTDLVVTIGRNGGSQACSGSGEGGLERWSFRNGRWQRVRGTLLLKWVVDHKGVRVVLNSRTFLVLCQ